MTSFGHLSAFVSNPAQVRELLAYLPKKPSSVQEAVAEALAAKGMKVRGYQAPAGNGKDIVRTGTYYYGRNGRVATLWNDDFSLWNVEYLAREATRHSPKTLLGAALTDGIFTLVLAKQGECLTRHVAGAAHPRIAPSPGDAGVLAEAFGLPGKKAEIAEALQQQDVDAQIASLEQLCGLKLRLGDAEELTKAGWRKVTV